MTSPSHESAGVPEGCLPTLRNPPHGDGGVYKARMTTVSICFHRLLAIPTFEPRARSTHPTAGLRRWTYEEPLVLPAKEAFTLYRYYVYHCST